LALIGSIASAPSGRVDEVEDPGQFLALGGFIKTLLIGHPNDLGIVRAELTPIVAEHGRLVRTRGDYLEIIPVGASKGAALVRLSAYLGVPLDRVVAVGDQENDVEMLREAGLGVAMPHAPEPVRRAADRVAPAAPVGGLLRLRVVLCRGRSACPSPDSPPRGGRSPASRAPSASWG
jgi:hydroxymethylpyrimidine pyrophosphatase-like HAD family hydrolase